MKSCPAMRCYPQQPNNASPDQYQSLAQPTLSPKSEPRMGQPCIDRKTICPILQCLTVLNARSNAAFQLRQQDSRLIDQTTPGPLTSAITPKPVKSHPFPIASMSGCATTPPTQEKIFLTKLFTATPEEARLGMNSVSMVVAMAKMSMLPTPKKKLAINYGLSG
jgi:hypothetical protein